MVSYSGREFAQDWRFAIDQDFTRPDGSPYPYATDDNGSGQRQWGDELHQLKFEHKALCISASRDGKRLAVAVGNDIHIINTKTWETDTILRGHVSNVASLAFHPNDSSMLVSSHTSDHEPATRELTSKCTIIFWNLDRPVQPGDPTVNPDVIAQASKAAVEAAFSKLSVAGTRLKDADANPIESVVNKAVTRAVTEQLAEGLNPIHGRLQTSFQSQVFSPSGTSIVILPGEHPKSNGRDDWTIDIYKTKPVERHLILKGHTDAIMWTGWNCDETLFASVAWDGSIRIWDAKSGEKIHQFETEQQNWTGAFSPDSKYFAATDGYGTVRIYTLPGSNEDREHWVYEFPRPRSWTRAIAWHRNSKWLAAGRDRGGQVVILDVEARDVIQSRTLTSTKSVTEEEEQKRLVMTFVGVSQVQFADRGNKLVLFTHGDGCIEVYDIKQQVKWRFARGGTDDELDAEKWRDENGKVTSKSGYSMTAWEDHDKGKLMMVSNDCDAVRVWSVDLTRD